MLAAIERDKTMSEADDLGTHVSLCEIRYKHLQEKLDDMEDRLTALENKVSTLAKETQAGFTEIKLLIEKQNTIKQTQIIATVGTVIAAILGLIGYIVVKIH